MKATEVLKLYWGYSSFRFPQAEIIQAVVQRKDVLAVLPTGGGKSICFQVPTMMMEGLCIVVTPLIALMQDQVSQLKKNGIPAIAIHSGLSHGEIDILLDNCVYGQQKFLYVSPERLKTDLFRVRFQKMNVSLIAIDEAHCISQWGYDFRPSFLKIAGLRAYLNNVQVLALTASATAEVVEDIQEKLEFKKPHLFRQSFERKNLRYVVQFEENKAQRLLKLIRSLGGSGLVYVRNRKLTESTAAFLNANNISSQAYHAGLKYEQRQAVQDAWTNNNTQVICATNAFGMGIDKPDVRFVVHLDLPDSLEAYFQEAGRAGRDGKIAYAAVFYTKADQQKLQEQFEQAFPPADVIKQTYQAICNYYQVAVNSGQGLTVDFEIDKICRSYNLTALQVFNSVKFLEREDYLGLLDLGYEPSRLMFLASKETAYDFQIRNPKFELLIKTLLRSYGGLYDNYVHVVEKDLAYRCKMSQALVKEQLEVLNKHELISYFPQSSIPKLVFLQNRVHAKYLQLSPDNYKLLKEKAHEKMQAVLDYTANNKVCRQVQLLMYFNELHFSDCGHCDVCLQKKTPDLNKLKKKITELLSAGPLSMESLRKQFKTKKDEIWVNALNEMIDEGQVQEKKKLLELKQNV